jgi:hypothetical protein
MNRSLFIFFLLSLMFAVSGHAADRYDVQLGDCPFLGPENAPITIIEFIDYQ